MLTAHFWWINSPVPDPAAPDRAILVGAGVGIRAITHQKVAVPGDRSSDHGPEQQELRGQLRNRFHAGPVDTSDGPEILP
jgi:hypothetical protein